MNRKIRFIIITVFALFVAPSCRKSSGDASSDSVSSGSQVTAVDKEAIDAVTAEVSRHWSKTADGYVSAFNSGNSFAPNYVRQLRDITVAGVETDDLGDSDKMNGVQWAGKVNFKKAPSREAGDPGPVMSDWASGGMRAKGRWSQWVDVTPESIHAQKVKGQWQFRQDTMLLVGTQPTPGDYKSARVQP